MLVLDFINVGNGDSTLIRDDHSAELDPRSQRIYAGDFLKKQGVTHLDMVVLTHFHRDHIGAGAVLAGVVEPASATPVIVEDGVLVGANAVVIEGVHIGKNAVVAAGAIVIEDVPENAVVAGSPARVIKMKDEKTEGKTALVDALRKL